MPLTASLVISGVSALGKMGVGVGQLLHAKKLAKGNVRPTFDIQDEYFQNQDIAARMAQRGLSDEALQYFTEQNQRGLTASTGALLQAGGGINSLVSAYETYQDGALEIAARDAELQNKNIMYYMDKNETVGKLKTQKWAIDKYEPYKNTAAAAAQEKSAGTNNLFTGMAEAGATLSSYSQSKNYEDMVENLGRTGAGSAVGAGLGRAIPSGQTNYSPGYGPDSNYGEFSSPFDDPYPVPARQPQAQQQPAQQQTDAGNPLTAEELEMFQNILFKLKK